MPIDYSKLTHIASDWTGGKREAQAPKRVPDSHSVLDDLDCRGKITDVEAEKPQTKVMIIDDTQIKRIMNAPRDEKRKILSRLTDSQRRRLLSRYNELSKIKDDETVNKLNYVNLDAILNDCVYVPDAYHLNLLDQWTSTYTVPEEIAGFVDAVRANDRTALAANLDNYVEWCKANEVATEIEQAQDVIENDTDTETIPDSVLEEIARFRAMRISDEKKELDAATTAAIKEAAKSDTATLASSDKSKDDLADYSINAFTDKGYDYTDVSEVYNTAWDSAYKAQAADSAKKLATANKKLADAKKKISDLESQLKKVSDEAKKVADSAKKISDLEAKLAERRIMDDVIDEIAQKPLLNQDGQEVKPVEDRPIMAVLSEALEAYANGDATLLDKLSSTTLNGNAAAGVEPTEEEPVEEPVEEPAEEESEEPIEEPEAGVSEANPDEEENEEEEEKLGDSAASVDINPCPYEKADEAEKDEEARDKELAKELTDLLKSIEKGEVKDSARLNSLIDSLSDKVPALKKYNFKIEDFTPVMSSYEPCMSINPPLSRDEYYSIAPVIPDVFDLICQQQNYPLCPKCQSYEVQPNGLCVNPGPSAQMYYPCNCTLQAIADLLRDAAAEDYTKIVNEHCIPMSDALRLAALTNNLSFIDNTFYKKHVNDSEWVFDSVPACLKEFTSKPGAIKLVAKATDSTINLFGQNFELL